MRAFQLEAGAHHFLDGFFGHEFGHAIVDAAPGQYHMGVVAQHFRLVRQVIRIDADAVATDQARPEWQKVPFGAGRLQHFQGIDADPVEDDGQLVHQRDVQIALGVFDYLGGLGHANAGGPVHAGLDYAFIQARHLVQGGRVVAGHHLADTGQGVRLVARIDALGRKTDMEIFFPAQARMLFQQGNADFFGGARVDGRLENDDGAALHVAPCRGAGAGQGGKIGIVGAVDGRRYGNDDEVGQLQFGRVAAHAEPLRGA